MNWEQALRSRLLDDSDVAGVVGTRVAWGVAPQKWKPPFVILTLVSDVRDQHFKGFQGLRASRVQVDCYGLDRASTYTLREYALAAIADGGTFDSVRFDRIADVSVRDLGANTDTGFVHRDSIDALIWHE